MSFICMAIKETYSIAKTFNNNNNNNNHQIQSTSQVYIKKQISTAVLL